jgi:hypothetical protein
MIIRVKKTGKARMETLCKLLNALDLTKEAALELGLLRYED